MKSLNTKRKKTTIFAVLLVCLVLFTTLFVVPLIAQVNEISTGGEIININALNSPNSSTFELETLSSEGELIVLQNAIRWSQIEDLDVFSNPKFKGEKIIAPNSSGSYSFTLKNTANFSIDYEINMLDQNIYKLPMEFRLKKGGSYIGGLSKWMDIKELEKITGHLDINARQELTLDWRWNGNLNDANDTAVGLAAAQNEEVKYILNFRVTAVQAGAPDVPDTGISAKNTVFWITVLILAWAALAFLLIFLLKKRREKNPVRKACP